MANRLATLKQVEDKKKAGFVAMVVCVAPVNGWTAGEVMSWHKTMKAAENKANNTTSKAFKL